MNNDNRYVNMQKHPIKLQKEHGTYAAALVMRLNGCSLKFALAMLCKRNIQK